MSWTQEEEEAYIFEQSIKKKSVKQLEQEIIDRLSVLNSEELIDVIWKIYNIVEDKKYESR